MITWTFFSKNIQKLLQSAFSSPGTDPDLIAEFLIRNLPYRPTAVKDRGGLAQFIKERRINEVVHFTRLENIPSISKFGLIPREYLKLNAINMALSPIFSDKYRLDKSEISNCLSFTFPNHKMFYLKRKDKNFKAAWAVISFEASIISDIYCEYSFNNAAKRNEKLKPSLEQLRYLFSNLNYRLNYGLKSNETTNPQTEIQEDTVLSSQKIQRIYVEKERFKIYLDSKNVKNVVVDASYFHNRHDYHIKDCSTSLVLMDDYEDVLNFEKNSCI